jgi:hypothetical protein
MSIHLIAGERLDETSMSAKLWRAVWLMAAALVVVSLLPTVADAQTLFYKEVARDGRIYVFAVQSRYDAFMQTGGAEIGAVIERPGYGPAGETVLFDSEQAIDQYNQTHGLPAEHVQKSEPIAESKFPSSTISGLMFGDYYWYYEWHQDQISSDNPTAVQGQHGLWFRRIYFTYDFAYSERLTTRFRLEANSNGEFADEDLVPYIKDAYLKWTFRGEQELTLGIQPTLTFEWLDGFWGLRHIEKTPSDLYGLDSSRDFAITVNGPTRMHGLSYAAQFGNESGSGSEGEEGKILRFESRYERDSGIALEGFYGFGTRPAGGHRQTAQAIAGFRNAAAPAPAQYLWQERKSGQDDIQNQTIGVWSGFAVWDVRPKKADLFFRVDRVKGHSGGVETGLPGAEEIDYWLLSSHSPFTTWILGGEWFLHPAVRVSPNIELVRYSHDPDPTNFPGRRSDSILRLTFFWTFSSTPP